MNNSEYDREMMSAIVNKYTKIHDNLSTIVNAYEALIIWDCECETVDELTLKKKRYKSAKSKILTKINELSGMTYKQVICKHNFIDDYIDIGPEKSQKITYCKLCEYTPPI